MDIEIERLRNLINSVENRLTVAETMQPVIIRSLDEIKAEILSFKAMGYKFFWVVLSAFIGAIVLWIVKGGLTITPGSV